MTNLFKQNGKYQICLKIIKSNIQSKIIKAIHRFTWILLSTPDIHYPFLIPLASAFPE